MYLYKLIIRNILKMFKESKGIFLYILSGIIVSVYGFLFYSGYLMTNFFSQKQAFELNVDLRNCTQQYIQEIISEILNEKSLEYISVYSDNPEYNNIKVVGMFDANFSENILYGNHYSKNDSNPYVIISDYTANRLGYNGVITGKKIDINNITYEMVGIHSFSDDICVPPYFFIKNNKATEINASFTADISKDLLGVLNNKTIKYKLKNNSNIFSSPEYLLNLSIVIMIFSVSFLNIIALFSFWKIRMKNTFLIYYLCGSKNKDILIIVFGTLMVILSFGSFIGLGLFGITFSRLVEFNIISNLPFRNYFSIFLWIYIVLSVFSVLFGIQSSNMKFEKNQKENI